MISDPNFATNDKIRMIEIMLPPRDVPQALLDRWVVEKEQSKQVQEENENSSAVDTPTPEFQPLLKKIKLDTDLISPPYYQGPSWLPLECDVSCLIKLAWKYLFAEQ